VYFFVDIKIRLSNGTSHELKVRFNFINPDIIELFYKNNWNTEPYNDFVLEFIDHLYSDGLNKLLLHSFIYCYPNHLHIIHYDGDIAVEMVQ